MSERLEPIIVTASKMGCCFAKADDDERAHLMNEKNAKAIEFTRWLKLCGLEDVQHTFESMGFNDLGFLREYGLGEDDMDAMMLTAGQRKRLKTYIDKLKVSDITWIPDSDAPKCMMCHASFGCCRGRHHCRNCGMVFCSKCAPRSNMRAIPQYGYKEPVRHCRGCYVRESVPSAGYQESG